MHYDYANLLHVDNHISWNHRIIKTQSIKRFPTKSILSDVNAELLLGTIYLRNLYDYIIQLLTLIKIYFRNIRGNPSCSLSAEVDVSRNIVLTLGSEPDTNGNEQLELSNGGQSPKMLKMFALLTHFNCNLYLHLLIGKTQTKC